MYKIEKNIEMPEIPSKYPLRKMNVGDSFLVPNDHIERKTKNGVRSAIYSSARTVKNKKFSVRTVAEGFRVWRIE